MHLSHQQPAPEPPQPPAPTPAAPAVPTKVLDHHVYPNPRGGLHCVWVKLEYSDGTKTQGVESSVPLGDSDAGLKLLRVYVRTAKGKRVAKYMPFE